jgi:AraC-like DNA-binding protein
MVQKIGDITPMWAKVQKPELPKPADHFLEVAERCGFCNPAYFASVFKKHVKCTPREFASKPHRWEPPGGPSALALADERRSLLTRACTEDGEMASFSGFEPHDSAARPAPRWRSNRRRPTFLTCRWTGVQSDAG